MRSMVVERTGPAETQPGPGQIRVCVEVCGVCRTDLHVVEGDLAPRRGAVVPGHEIVGRVDARGPAVDAFAEGDLVGVAWLSRTCGRCRFCSAGRENLCLEPRFTGWEVDGGYAEYCIAEADFVYPLAEGVSARDTAPLLCAGIIGFRAVRRSGIQPGGRLGLYGFGGSAHIATQLARHFGCEVYVFSRGSHQSARALRRRSRRSTVAACWRWRASISPMCRRSTTGVICSKSASCEA